MAAAHVPGVAERLRRCSVLAAGFPQRLRLLVAAGLPAAMYGIGQSNWPPRRGALGAVMRSTFRVATEAFSALLSCGCREDAGARAGVDASGDQS